MRALKGVVKLVCHSNSGVVVNANNSPLLLFGCALFTLGLIIALRLDVIQILLVDITGNVLAAGSPSR